MTREFDFSRNTKIDLAQAAQFRCVRPGCNKPTHLYDPVAQKWIHAGAAAHDAPASPNEGGERADNDLTPEQKKAYGNGAWLCRSCSTLVDIAQRLFPLGTLPAWQTAACEALLKSTLGPVQPSSIDFVTAATKVQQFLDLVKPIVFEWHWKTLAIPVSTLHEILRARSRALPLLPLGSYSGLFPHIVNVQLRQLDSAKAIKEEVTDQSSWHIDRGYYRCNMADFRAAPGQTEQFKESHDRVVALVNDFKEARCYLQDFVSGRLDHHTLYLW